MRRVQPVLSCLLFALSLAGCVTAGVTAINPLTGEEREFADETEVPEGWIVCSSAETCPSPRACAELDEASCLARTDCSPTYVGIGAYPRECETQDPPPDICDGTAFAGCTDAATTCTDDACGPAPLGATWLCPDGSVGGVTGRCIQHADGVCGWETRDCPPPPVDECSYDECGPAPESPTIICPDGSLGGNTGRCLRNADGACGWEYRECPTVCSGIACDLACPPGTTNPIGPDGCLDTCRCVPTECSADECGSPPDSPTYLCADGSTGGNTGVCYRREDGTCGWEYRECPTEECPVDACGPQLGLPNYPCDDGSYGGPTGRCLANADGTCGWEVRECPATSCSDIPQCDLVCAPGTHNPIDENGCLHSCECVPDSTCSDIPVCRLACPVGTHNPVDADGCVHTCECVADSSDAGTP